MEQSLLQLGHTIKEARQAADLTQELLSEKVDITSRFVMGIENEGRNPSFTVLCKSETQTARWDLGLHHFHQSKKTVDFGNPLATPDG